MAAACGLTYPMGRYHAQPNARAGLLKGNGILSSLGGAVSKAGSAMAKKGAKSILRIGKKTAKRGLKKGKKLVLTKGKRLIKKQGKKFIKKQGKQLIKTGEKKLKALAKTGVNKLVNKAANHKLVKKSALAQDLIRSMGEKANKKFSRINFKRSLKRKAMGLPMIPGLHT